MRVKDCPADTMAPRALRGYLKKPLSYLVRHGYPPDVARGLGIELKELRGYFERGEYDPPHLHTEAVVLMVRLWGDEKRRAEAGDGLLDDESERILSEEKVR